MRSILVAFDGSKPSKGALEYAFQTFPSANFTVLYTLDADRSESGLFEAKALLRWIRSSEDRAHELRDIVEKLSVEYDVTATIEMTVGNLAKNVIQRCETGEFEQVFVGNYNRGSGRRRLFTNVTERIVRRVTLPVTVVPATDNRSFGSPPEVVLVPIDGSSQAKRALAYACEMFPRSNITGLNVIDPIILHFDELSTDEWEVGAVDEWEAALESHGDEIEALAQDLQAQSRAVLQKASARAASKGVELSTVSVKGWPDEEILEYVVDHSIDHVCMGCHGQSTFERFILGSATESILRECNVPVTTLRSGPNRDRT